MSLALQMTQSVHQQPRDLSHEISAGCLPLCLFHRDDDIAQHTRHSWAITRCRRRRGGAILLPLVVQREGQNVCRLVLASVGPIELANLSIIGEHDGQLGVS